MKIALIGYGKMGKAIEKIATERGHEIVARVSREHSIDKVDFSNVDVAIEFTVPGKAVEHLKYCVNNNTPVVVGTTAWHEYLEEVKEFVTKNNGTLLYASNFSIGVNLFFELNRKLAELINPYPEYNVRVEETHHTEKLDAPSGTAISIVDDIMLTSDKLNAWRLVSTKEEADELAKNVIPVFAHRKPAIPGTHQVNYSSEIDDIEIKHTAKSRKGFALGAVIAAEWLLGKKGIFTMKDVIQ